MSTSSSTTSAQAVHWSDSPPVNIESPSAREMNYGAEAPLSPSLSSILPVDLAEDPPPVRIRVKPAIARNKTRAFRAKLRNMGVSIQTFSNPPFARFESKPSRPPTSPIGRLPVELLTDIFFLAAFTRSYEDRNRVWFPLPMFNNLALVCSLWMKVIINCPPLWLLAASYAPSVPAMLRLLLRSTGAPIHLNTMGSSRNDFVAKLLPKARSFECYANYIPWTAIMNEQRRFLNLELLWFQRPRAAIDGPTPILVLYAPKLTTLRMDSRMILHGSSLHTLIVGLPRITEAILLDIRGLLQQSPRLAVLYFDPPTQCDRVNWSAALRPLAGGPLRELHILATQGSIFDADTFSIQLPNLKTLVLLAPAAIIAPRVEEATLCGMNQKDFHRMLRGVTHAASLTIESRRRKSPWFDIDSYEPEPIEFNRLSVLNYHGSINDRLFTILRRIRAPWVTIKLQITIATFSPFDGCYHEVNDRGPVFDSEVRRLSELRPILESCIRGDEATLHIESFVRTYSELHRIVFTLVDSGVADVITTAGELQSAGLSVEARLPVNFCQDTLREGFMVTACHVLSGVASAAVTIIRMPVQLLGPEPSAQTVILGGHYVRVPYEPVYPDWTFPDPLNLPEEADVDLLRLNLLRMRRVRELDLTILRFNEASGHTLLRVLQTDTQKSLFPILSLITLRAPIEYKSSRIGRGQWWAQIMAIAELRSDLRIEFAGNFCCCRDVVRVRAYLRRLQCLVKEVTFSAERCTSCA